jgi:eukaryotic-like serine/threonine-protein kinase
MEWANESQTATLASAGDGGQDVVPTTLVSSWYDQYSIEGQVTNGLDEVTIEQGQVGDSILRFSTTHDGVTCVRENVLAGVDGDRILLGPDTVQASESATGCTAEGSFWASLHTDGSTLLFALTSTPDSDPYPVQDDL